MNLESLTKHQILLLTLLVSFVTSIATGIVTVTLVAQAPAPVQQTINQVVERTVETVVPVEIASNEESPTDIVTEERIVYVSDTDRLAEAVSNVGLTIAHVYEFEDTRVYEEALENQSIEGGVFVGIASSLDGFAIELAPAVSFGEDFSYLALLSGGEIVEIELDVSETVDGLRAIMYKDTQSLTRATLTDPQSVPAGTRVASLYGENRRVVEGIIESEPLHLDDGRVVFETSIDTSVVNVGSPLFDLDGKVFGLLVADEEGRRCVAPRIATVQGVNTIEVEKGKVTSENQLSEEE